MGAQVTNSGNLERIARFEKRTAAVETLKGRFKDLINAYRDRYGQDCFRDDNAFLDAFYGLAMRDKLFPHLGRALERKLGKPLGNIEAQYEEALLSQAMHLTVNGDVQLNLLEYYWMEGNAIDQQLRDDQEPDVSVLEGILSFLERHLDAPALENPDAMAPTLANSPKLEAARRARRRFAAYLAQQGSIESVLHPYNVTFGHNCFESDAKFVRELYLLAKERKILPVLRVILEHRLGRECDDFESQYEGLLVAKTMGRIMETEVKLDISDYIWFDMNAAHEQIRRDEDPDFARINAILGFLDEVKGHEALVPFWSKLPVAPLAPSGDVVPRGLFGEALASPLAAELGGEARRDASTLVKVFDIIIHHPKIRDCSRSLFRDGHYASAILEAFKVIDNLVREKSGESELNGRALMAKVFHKDNPKLRVNELATPSDRDEHEGLLLLLMGAMVGIRNPKAHDNIVQVDPIRALQYLAFADLLARRVEESSKI